MSTLSIHFEGFWQCRLATDPDPSDEQRGISGFTYSVAGETLLEPTFWSQAKDIQQEYGLKDPEFSDSYNHDPMFKIKNIRQASPDYEKYNDNGIGIKVTGIQVDGIPFTGLSKLIGGAVRFEKRPQQPNWPWRGPIFEGRNQITSDGDPDRFTLNPFVISISDLQDNVVLRRFDPLNMQEPDQLLWQINPSLPDFDEIVKRRLPRQRFALSNELLVQVGIDPDNMDQHFVNRAIWLQEKILEAEALGREALAQSFRSRYFAVNFFTQSTGPTVLANRLLSRIPLRQLYKHSIRGNEQMQPVPFVDPKIFAPLTVNTKDDWEILYYLGAYDGDLLAGWCSGTLSLPVSLGQFTDEQK